MYTIGCEALRSNRCLRVHYSDYVRIVEVHAVGLDLEGNAVMRVWQVRGGIDGNEPVAWKLLRLNEIVKATIIGRFSKAPREQYIRDDPEMSLIVCQV